MNSVADALRVDQVHVWRGTRHVLRGVSFRVSAGEVLHVSGPNGTGKTTLLRVITGLLRPERGSVEWYGKPIGAASRDYQAELAYASHEPALKGDLTALENLQFTAGLRRRVTSDELRAFLERTGVGNCAGLPARVLSAGQRRRVALARVLAVRAVLWLLDEPFTHLDAAGCEMTLALLREHVAQGGLALVVAHNEFNADNTRQLELNA